MSFLIRHGILLLWVAAIAIAVSVAIAFLHYQAAEKVIKLQLSDATVRSNRLDALYRLLAEKLKSDNADLDIQYELLSNELRLEPTLPQDTILRLQAVQSQLAAAKSEYLSQDTKLAALQSNVGKFQLVFGAVQSQKHFPWSGTYTGDTLVTAQRLLSATELQVYDLATAQSNTAAGVAAAKTTIALPPGTAQITKVFYATDRNLTGRDERGPSYGRDRGERLQYGWCTVSIPEDHKMGHFETPSVWRLHVKFDPKKDIMFQEARQLSEQEFYTAMHSAVSTATSHEVFVFVHGFANSFTDAARRTAQLSYDLGYPGVPVMYSWPSGGTMSFDGYRHDETNVDWTVPHLKQFLFDVAAQSGATNINLVAHSMGNKVLSEALVALGAEIKNITKPTFNQVILTAPDIDADVFKDTLVPAMHRLSERVTLYASSNDEALKFSKRLHGNYRRAGDTSPEMIVTSDLDSVDVSAVDSYFCNFGHAYFADNRSVISDLFLIFRDGSPPSRRNLLSRSKGQLQYWIFRP